MHDSTIVFNIFLIFTGAAVFSTLALYTRQSMLVAYILLGVLFGPSGLKLIGNANLVERTGDVGIIFLLFLIGLNLQPQNLLHMFKRTTWIALVSSLVFAVIGYAVARLMGLTETEGMIVGTAMMFSSTIIGLKLLPTTVLHHQHTGEIMISILLMQDLLAIVALLVIQGIGATEINLARLGLIVFSLPALVTFAFVFQRFVIVKLFTRFDRIREYMFLLAIAWCLSMSVLAEQAGLSYEVGAFIAGVSIAEGPIALYIAESLKPLRDFFLVLFFFSVGAGFDLNYLKSVVMPSLLLATLLLLLKPVVFRFLLRQTDEPKHIAWEIGWRLGQVSEFSLLLAYVAGNVGLIGQEASNLIQATSILTFIISSYIVILRYPTPMAVTDKLRRD